MQEHIFTFDEVYQAYLACRKQKRNTINALRFEVDLECNLEKLVYELNNKKYSPARSVCFTILEPKPREIFAADFRDRIVHHLLFNYLNPIYEKKFIYDSFACRKNKGTLASVKRVQKYLRKITQNNKKTIKNQ
jgi:RNA-directed DNA polymerase